MATRSSQPDTGRRAAGPTPLPNPCRTGRRPHACAERSLVAGGGSSFWVGRSMMSGSCSSSRPNRKRRFGTSSLGIRGARRIWLSTRLTPGASGSTGARAAARGRARSSNGGPARTRIGDWDGRPLRASGTAAMNSDAAPRL